MIISPQRTSPFSLPLVSGGQEPFSFGNALQFDGVNDYVSFSNTSEIHNSSNHFTLSFWFKLTSSISTFCHFINLKSDVGQALCITTADTSKGIYSGIGVNFSGQNLGFGSEFTPTVNEWHHLGITGKINNSSNSDFICLYDGVNLSQRQGGGYGVLTNITTLSRNLIYKSPFILDEIVFYQNYKSNESELLQFYNNGNGNFPSFVLPNESPTVYLRLNGTSGDSTAIDEQGNYDGTLNNFDTATCWVAH